MIRHRSIGTFILFLMIFFTSCDKDHLFDCLKNTGSMTSEKRSSGEFNRIDVYNNPEVIIAQDVENSITVQAGDHVISGITTEISGGVLTIRNENKCNWVRSYAKTIAVYVHVKNLRIIHHHGSSTISSANQLQSTAFDLNVWNSGDINLSVKADSVYSRQHTTVGDITLSGETKYCFLYNNGNGFSYQSSLVADDEVIVQRGTGDCMVNVNQQLNVEIHDSGNVYYSGNPRVTSSITGVGRLIHQ